MFFIERSLIAPWCLWKIIELSMISLKSRWFPMVSLENDWFVLDLFMKSLIFPRFLWKIIDVLWLLWKIFDRSMIPLIPMYFSMISLKNHCFFNDCFAKSLISNDFYWFLYQIWGPSTFGHPAGVLAPQSWGASTFGGAAGVLAFQIWKLKIWCPLFPYLIFHVLHPPLGN